MRANPLLSPLVACLWCNVIISRRWRHGILCGCCWVGKWSVNSALWSHVPLLRTRQRETPRLFSWWIGWRGVHSTWRGVHSTWALRVGLKRLRICTCTAHWLGQARSSIICVSTNHDSTLLLLSMLEK